MTTTSDQPLTRQDIHDEIDRGFGRVRQVMLDHYATKADLANLETRLVREIGDANRELTAQMTLHLRWMIGLQLGGLALVGGLVATLVSTLG